MQRLPADSTPENPARRVPKGQGAQRRANLSGKRTEFYSRGEASLLLRKNKFLRRGQPSPFFHAMQRKKKGRKFLCGAKL